MLNEEIKIQLEKLSLKKNDILLIKCSKSIDIDNVQRMAVDLKETINRKVLFYTDDLDFSILTDGELKGIGLKRI